MLFKNLTINPIMNPDPHLAKALITFVQHLNHAIRAPLNGVIGFSEILLQEAETYGLNDDGKEIVDIINTSCRKINSAWNDYNELLGLINNANYTDVETIRTDELVEGIEKNLENHWLTYYNKVNVSVDSISISSFRAVKYEIELALTWIIAEMVNCCRIQTVDAVEIAVRSFQKGDQIKLVIFQKNNVESSFKKEQTITWPFIEKIISNHKGEINMHYSETNTPVIIVSIPA
jgi:signal transduction histidine kinase